MLHSWCSWRSARQHAIGRRFEPCSGQGRFGTIYFASCHVLYTAPFLFLGPSAGRCAARAARSGPVESRQTIQTWNTGLDGFSDYQTKSKPSLNQYQTYVPNQMQTDTKPFFFEWYKPMSNLVQTKIKLGVAAGHWQALSQTELQRNRRLRQIGQQLNHG